jgi:hypothetical protein
VHSYHATLKTVRLYRNVAVDSRGQSSVATTTTVRASHESRESDPLGVGDRQCVRLLVNYESSIRLYKLGLLLLSIFCSRGD